MRFINVMNLFISVFLSIPFNSPTSTKHGIQRTRDMRLTTFTHLHTPSRDLGKPWVIRRSTSEFLNLMKFLVIWTNFQRKFSHLKDLVSDCYYYSKLGLLILSCFVLLWFLIVSVNAKYRCRPIYRLKKQQHLFTWLHKVCR